LRTNLMDYFHYSIKQGLSIDGEWLRRFVEKGTSNPNDLPLDLIGYFKYYLEIKVSEIRDSTKKKIKSYIKRLAEFEEWARRRYMLSEINHDFRMKLEEYGAQKKYASRYILDILNYVKVITRHARRNGLAVNQQFEEFKIKRKKKDYITLNSDELDLIEDLELKTDYLDNARDWLLICCETAQRVSDFKNFNKGMIQQVEHKNGDIISIIQFSQEKTDKGMAIFLSPRVLRILEKRDGNFPRSISAKSCNEYFKEVCLKAGITDEVEGEKVCVNPETKEKRKVFGNYPKYQLVTSHIGRRSFVSNRRHIWPDSIIRKFTGHTSDRMLSEYDHKNHVQSAIDAYDFIKKFEYV
jgi:hypothetical protein